jgi:hypothetical protein
MDNKTLLALIGLIAGLSFGAAISASTKTTDKCEKTEQAIREESNISGALACFQPGTIDVNLTEKVEQGAELECVCRRSLNGNVQLWAINRAN